MKTVEEIKQYIDSKDWAEKFYKNVETLNGGRFDWGFLNVNPELTIAGKFDFTETHEGCPFWYNINREYLDWLYNEELDTDKTYPLFVIKCVVWNGEKPSIIKRIEEKDYENACKILDDCVEELFPLHDKIMIDLDKYFNPYHSKQLKSKIKGLTKYNYENNNS